jgi:hypothetical protein
MQSINQSFWRQSEVQHCHRLTTNTLLCKILFKSSEEGSFKVDLGQLWFTLNLPSLLLFSKFKGLHAAPISKGAVWSSSLSGLSSVCENGLYLLQNQKLKLLF